MEPYWALLEELDVPGRHEFPLGHPIPPKEPNRVPCAGHPRPNSGVLVRYLSECDDPFRLNEIAKLADGWLAGGSIKGDGWENPITSRLLPCFDHVKRKTASEPSHVVCAHDLKCSRHQFFIGRRRGQRLFTT